jgi:hypothetical protein
VGYIPRNRSLYGRVSLTKKTEKFNDPVDCTGNLTIPSDIEVWSVKATSYSGRYWTDNVKIFNSLSPGDPFQLWSFEPSVNYSRKGDPFIVDIMAGNVTTGELNLIEVWTGLSEFNTTGCSEDDRIIYTVRLPTLVGYGDVFRRSEGCNWIIGFSDGTNLTEKIPSIYNGTQGCTYIPGNISYDMDDAIDDSVYRLLTKLDLEDDGEVDVVFDPNNVDFDLGRAGGVQSLWGPVKFKLIVWM